MLSPGSRYSHWQIIPTADAIDSYDWHSFRFWLGAIGEVVPIPRADRDDVQIPNQTGLRWKKIAHRTALLRLLDAPHRRSQSA